MRICLPIILLIVTLCIRAGSLESNTGGGQLQPPLPPEVLRNVYATATATVAAAAVGDVDVADMRDVGDVSDLGDVGDDTADHDSAATPAATAPTTAPSNLVKAPASPHRAAARDPFCPAAELAAGPQDEAVAQE